MQVKKAARVGSLVVALALATTSCGGGKGSGNSEGADGDSSTTVADGGASSDGKAGENGSGGGASTPTSRPGDGSSVGSATTVPPGGNAGGAGGGPTTTAKVIHITGRLEPSCLHPGDQLKLIVQSQPTKSVIWDTSYSDKSSDMSTEGAYGSGNGRGKTDAVGAFETSWTVSPKVPTGQATVYVTAAYNNELESIALPLMVKPLTEPC